MINFENIRKDSHPDGARTFGCGQQHYELSENDGFRKYGWNVPTQGGRLFLTSNYVLNETPSQPARNIPAQSAVNGATVTNPKEPITVWSISAATYL